MSSRLNITPSTKRELVQLAPPTGNPACPAPDPTPVAPSSCPAEHADPAAMAGASIPVDPTATTSLPAVDAEPTDAAECAPDELQPNAPADAGEDVGDGCEAEERMSIATTRERPDEGFEQASRKLPVADHCFDPAALASQATPDPQEVFGDPRETTASCQQAADRPSSLVETDCRGPAGGASGDPEVDATDQARERVDAAQPPIEQPPAGREDDARSFCRAGGGDVDGLHAPQGGVDGTVERPLPEAATSQAAAIGAVPPDGAEAAKRIVDDQLGVASKRDRTKLELLSSASTRRSDGYDIKNKYRWKASYGALIKHCQDKPNAERNVAILRKLMRTLGRTEADDASSDLESDVTMDAFLESVGRNPNRVSALTYIRLLAKDPTKQGFAELIRAQIVRWTEQGGSISSLAREIGTSPQALWRFANHDVRPHKSRRGALEKLEAIGGLEKGSLTGQIAAWSRTAFVFREPYFDLKNPLYVVRKVDTTIVPLSGNAIPQIQAFFGFKTSRKIDPTAVLPDGTERKLIRSGVWTPSIRAAAKLPKAFEKWSHYPSASICLIILSRCFSFVTGELGRPADSLAMVLDVEAVERFLQRDVELAGGFNNGHLNSIRMVSQLLHPEHGFLVQLPEIFEPEARRLGIVTDDVPWAEFVAARHAEVSLLPAKFAPDRPARRRATRTRDKKRKLVGLLSLSDSYGQVVYPTLQRMFAERPPKSAPEIVRLDFEIKYLTLALFASCPMRLLNWAYAEWDTNLRKGEGRWWVHVAEPELKNRRVAPGDFVFMLPEWASSIVDRFSAGVRPRMGKANPDAERLVLAGPQIYHGRAEGASNYSYDRAAAGKRVYTNIARRMNAVTEQLWNLPVSPHDWRDIYALDYLNKHPGEILTVAAILNDRIETVLKEYAQPDTARLSGHAAKALDAEWLAVAARLSATANPQQQSPPPG